MSVVTQIQIRRGTAAEWTSANPVLASGEWGYETDTNKGKIGNGVTAWNSLSYILGIGDIEGVTAGTGLSGGGTSGTVTLSIDTATTVDKTTAQTLSNKTISGSANTLTNIDNASLSNSAITINGTSVSLGGSISVGDITSVTAGTGLTGGGSSGDVTVSLSTPVSAANGGTGLSSLGTGVATWLGTPSSSNLAAAVTDETGSGALVFGTGPTLTDAKINLGIDAETASYTAVIGNNSQIVTMNNASANTFSIPTDAVVDFPVGAQITVLQIGAGQTTIQAVNSGTTTINSTGATANAPKLRVRYSSATCIKLSANNWVVIGDIS